MNFKSEYFDDVDQLIRAKNDAFLGVSDRKDRLRLVRNFTNMLNTMSDEEAADLGRQEIVNHGLTHAAMLQNETMFNSMATVTNALVEIIVDTDNPEQDLITGMRLSEAVNRGAIHRKGKFNNFWRKVSGELVIAGGGSVVMPEKYGWLPRLEPDMFFPGDTPLDADSVTYAFLPKELGMVDLKRLKKSSEKGGGHIDGEGVDALIETLEEQINARTLALRDQQEISRTVRNRSVIARSVTVPAYWYYEVKHRDSGDDYVSATLFIDSVTGVQVNTTVEKGQQQAVVIAYIEEAYKASSDWLHFVFVDSEIGGVKTMESLRGIAEMVYPSGAEMEELLNLTMEGDKIRAKPRFSITDAANPDDITRWDVVRDSYAPKGVEELKMNTAAGQLLTPFNILNQTAAGIATSGVSNGPRGGELRQQAVERQQNNGMLQTNRLVEAYNHLDSILETVVWRLLAGEVKPGTEGYHETMWVRDRLKKYDIDFAALASRKHGRFEHIRVRARRTVGNGDRVQQLETADWLMSNIQAYEPSVRPMIVHLATVLRTQDPDAADAFVKVPKAIINAQKITAENEFDTIRRRAPLGQMLPVAQDDIHQDHIPIHLLDMQALVATHGIRPWDKLDVITFAGAAEHAGEHIKILLSNPVTNAEGKVFVQDYQNITQAAQAIAQEVQDAQEGQQGGGMTEKEKADFQLKMGQLQLDAQKFGAQVKEKENLEQNRQQRTQLSQRQQYTREIQEAQRLQIERDRLEQQKKKDLADVSTKQ